MQAKVKDFVAYEVCQLPQTIHTGRSLAEKDVVKLYHDKLMMHKAKIKPNVVITTQHPNH